MVLIGALGVGACSFGGGSTLSASGRADVTAMSSGLMAEKDKPAGVTAVDAQCLATAQV